MTTSKAFRACVVIDPITLNPSQASTWDWLRYGLVLLFQGTCMVEQVRTRNLTHQVDHLQVQG